jgi:hypothetical protein
VPRAVGSALVAAHDPDRPEADTAVRSDGTLVRGGGIDGEAVMAADVDEVPSERPDRIGPQAATDVRCVQEEVDPGMAIAGLMLLGVLDAPDQPALQLDGKTDTVVIFAQARVGGGRGIRGVPPSRDLGLGEDVAQPIAVVGVQRPEMDPTAVEAGSRVAHERRHNRRTSIGTARPMASVTGQWSTAQATSSSIVVASPGPASIATSTRVESGPALMLRSSPSRPRSSDSLSTATSRLRTSIPSEAARMAMSVVTQDAAAARKYQPGDGFEAVPPIPVGMSVASRSPPGPRTSVRSPVSNRARASESR